LSKQAGARHPIDAAGKPFMFIGDAAWSLIAQSSREDAVTYLEDRKNRGFTAIIVNLLERVYATNAPANFYGDPPLKVFGDFSTPNEAYMAHAEYVLQQAQARGILVLLTPCYIGNGAEGWIDQMNASGTTKMEAYGKYVANRFSSLKNIMWLEGGDANPANKSAVEAVAKGIRSVTPNTLQSAHCAVDTIVLDYYVDEPWLDINTVYTRHAIYDACNREYQRAGKMPFMFIEGTYENENYGSGLANEQVERKEAYHSLLSGAFGHVFGNSPVWHFDGPGLFPSSIDWKTALSSAGARSMTFARNALVQADWTNLIPDFSGAFLTAGAGSGEDHAVVSISSTKSTAIAYLPSARSISINLAALSGPHVNLSWYDPSSGASTTIEAAVANTGIRSLLPPTKNASGFGDWVLLAKSVA
jgi:hypothetical protein